MLFIRHKFYLIIVVSFGISCASENNASVEEAKPFVLEDDFSKHNSNVIQKILWMNSSNELPLFKEGPWCIHPTAKINVIHRRPLHSNLCHSGVCDVGEDRGGGEYVFSEAVSYTHLTLPTIYSV